MLKVETPEEFAMRLVAKHFELCSKVRSVAMCDRITVPTAMIDEITARDTAIRAESATPLLRCKPFLHKAAGVIDDKIREHEPYLKYNDRIGDNSRCVIKRCLLEKTELEFILAEMEGE